jgi:hypothetical protein
LPVQLLGVDPHPESLSVDQELTGSLGFDAGYSRGSVGHDSTQEAGQVIGLVLARSITTTGSSEFCTLTNHESPLACLAGAVANATDKEMIFASAGANIIRINEFHCDKW